MSSKKISVEDLARAVADELGAYDQEVTDGIKQAVKEAADECRDEIKRNSPKRTGKYRRGWKDKVLYESPNDIRVTVYNRTSYQLTHLLENGHAKRDGGRVEGKPHIAPAEKNAEDKLLKMAKVVIKGK